MSELDTRLRAIEPRLLLFAAHRLGPALGRATEPADLVQETYVRLLGVELPPPSDDETELLTLARHLCRNAIVDLVRTLRAAKRDGGARPLPTGWSQPGHAPGPRTQAQIRETERDWLGAYRRLAPEHRRVLGLRQFEGLSARETAARMGRSEAAVHSLFRRALQAWESERESDSRIS